MQKKFFVPVFLFFLVCVSFPVLSEDSPLMKHCESIHLRSSEGWWVSIYDDGSGAYGFGEGLARIKVVKNTFSYEIDLKHVRITMLSPFWKIILGI